jgi:hypothetical protein
VVLIHRGDRLDADATEESEARRSIGRGGPEARTGIITAHSRWSPATVHASRQPPATTRSLVAGPLIIRPSLALFLCPPAGP